MRTGVAIFGAALSVTVVAGMTSPAVAVPDGDAGPGTVIATEPATWISDSLRSLVSTATEFRYRSTDPHGAPSTVSGAFYLPRGEKPSGGWPVVAFAHGTSGVEEQCAPSRSPDMYSYLPEVEALVQRGWAVVATDYQGLGSPGPAPYLDSVSEGANVLDSIRALHQLTPDVSPESVLFGVSQGGHAAEAAAEQAHDYAPELTVLGVALAVPALNLTPFTGAVDNGQLSVSQYGLTPLLVEAVQAAVAPELNPNDVVHGILAASTPILLQCTGVGDQFKGAISEAARPPDVVFTTPAARDAFDRFEAENALPKQAYQFPAFITRGTADTLVTTAWSDTAVADMCRLGIRVTQRLRPGDHVAVPDTDTPAVVDWIASLLNGSPPAGTCG
ncbi:lipase family protein [Nocardia sp. JMUB6875]|uniref:lipase family protein n=1 Tax=Nocardia sp. JMUB6875 TaxID=3158170 RepID=UPI0032E5CC81